MLRIKNKMMAFAAALLLAATTAMAAPVKDNNDEATQTAKEVRKKLVTLPYFGVFDNLAYKIDGDTVTLYGQVTRPVTRSDAAKRVAKVEGVERVVNQIEVLPISGFDDGIRVRTYRAISRTGGLYRYLLGVKPSIHIIVKNGHVTLEGVVSNKGDSNLANIAANGVSGVFSVTNNLRIERNS